MTSEQSWNVTFLANVKKKGLNRIALMEEVTSHTTMHARLNGTLFSLGALLAAHGIQRKIHIAALECEFTRALTGFFL